uniref:DUF397 domain-containing protein n=1 Tax=Plectus sambesii TaxID=2011161 RepID=A0A914WPB5_9BILA
MDSKRRQYADDSDSVPTGDRAVSVSQSGVGWRHCYPRHAGRSRNGACIERATGGLFWVDALGSYVPSRCAHSSALQPETISMRPLGFDPTDSPTDII